MILRLLTFVLIIAVTALGAPVALIAGQQTGSVSGTAVNSSNQPLGQHTVRLRSVSSSQIVARAQTNAAGQYSLSGLSAGQYIVEVVDAQGAVIGTSSTVTLGPGSMAAAGVVVTSSAAAGLAGGVVGGTAGSFLTSATGLTILAVATGAGLTTAIVARNDPASPTQ